MQSGKAGKTIFVGVLGAFVALAVGWVLGAQQGRGTATDEAPDRLVLAAADDGLDPTSTPRTFIHDAAVASLSVRRPETTADGGRAAATPRVGGCPDSGEVAATIGRLRTERALLCLINRQRRAAAVRPVTVDFKLRRAARKHADDMVRRRYFRHDSLDGRNFAQRVLGENYATARQSFFLGENLAWGAKERGTPAGMVSAWLSSPPHRVNLLDPRFRDVGIGMAPGGPVPTAAQAATVATAYGVKR